MLSLSTSVWRRLFAKGAITDIVMPALSPTMSKGNLIKWKKAVGDRIGAGDVVAEVETDKASLEFESQEEGFLANIYVEAGSADVPVGTPIAVMVEYAEDMAEAQTRTSQSSMEPRPRKQQAVPKTAVAASSSLPADTLSVEAAASPFDYGKALMSPSARHLLASARIDPRSVHGTGKHGMIIKDDALKAIASLEQVRDVAMAAVAQPLAASAPTSATPTAASASASATPTTAAGFRDDKVSNIRRIIAERLLESKRSHPHVYAGISVDMTKANAFREQMKAAGSRFSINDFFIAAMARAIAQTPIFQDTPAVDISIAVATDKGLLTPVVRSADKKPLSQISEEVRDLATRGRAGKLAPAEMSGGCFSISNLGMFGIDGFSAVINPPQLGILAVAQASAEVSAAGGGSGSGSVLFPLVESLDSQGESPLPKASGNAVGAVSTMNASLSFDGVRVTEEAAAALVRNFRRMVEDPLQLLL